MPCPPPGAFTFEATLEHIVTHVGKNRDGTPDESMKIDFDSNGVLITKESRVSTDPSYAFADRADGFGDAHPAHNADIGDDDIGILAIPRGIGNPGASNGIVRPITLEKSEIQPLCNRNTDAVNAQLQDML